MKSVWCKAALVFSLVVSSVSSPIESRQTGSGSFPTINGLRFKIDGVTKYFAGSNSYWISFLTNNRDVDLVLDNVARSGLKIFRIWGFNDVNQKPGSGTVYYQYLSSSGSEVNTGANGLQRLDAVVASAEKRGVKLIINFVNNWDDYGGIRAYLNAFGGTKQTWYTNTRAQAQYRKYIQAVVSRYANSSAVFAWELANEPRCQGCSTDVIFKWASDTSRYIKSLDSRHMVTLGDEGFGLPGGTSSTNYPYGTSEGIDFVKNLAIPTLDFGTFHWYPEAWGVTYNDGPAWIRNHGAACKQAGKPCLFEEYGATSNHCNVESPWQQASLTAEGVAGDLFWQWGDTLSTGMTHNDGHTIYYGSSDARCLVTDHVNNINRMP